MKVFLLVFSFILSSVWAYDEVPIPVTNHIKSSDLIIVGSYSGKNYRKLPNNEVVTEFKFNLISHNGLKRSNMEKNVEFKVLQSGGMWMGKEYFSKNPSSFEDSERVVLFLRKNKYGYWMVSTLQSKYIIEKHGRDEIMVSSAYPFHPTVGKFNFIDFSAKVSEVNGTKFTFVEDKSFSYASKSKRKFSDIYVNTKVQKRGRSIASVEDQGNRTPSNNTPSSTDPFWLLLGMGLLSGVYRVIRKTT